MLRWFALCAVLCCAGAAWWFLARPGRDTVLDTVRAAGFPQAAWAGEADIHLDPDGLSVLHGVRGQAGGAIAAEKLELVGEIGPDGAMTLAGWDGTIAAAPRLRAEALSINLATPLGGVFVRGTTAMEPGAARAILRTEQAQLSFVAKIAAQRRADGSWHATADVERGHLALPGLRLARLSGRGELSPAGWFGEFAAGGMRLGDTPWRDVSGSVQGGTVALQACALGLEGAELTMEGRAGEIYAPDNAAYARWRAQYGGTVPPAAPGAFSWRAVLQAP